MSKCHYIYDKQAGKVLIPCCWAVVLSNDIRVLVGMRILRLLNLNVNDITKNLKSVILS